MSDAQINTRTPIADKNGMVNKQWFLFFTDIKSRIALLTGKVSTTAVAGTAAALPATPEGYTVININGTDYKVPFYK